MKEKGKLLIVDDDAYVVLSLRMFLEEHFTTVQSLATPEQMFKEIEKQSFDVIILDMNFNHGETSGRDGLKYLESILEKDPDASVIMMTAYGGVNIAVEAIKKGAKDFLIKPWENERLLATVMSVFNLAKEKKNVKHLLDRERVITSTIDNQFKEIIGDSPAMKNVFETIRKVAGTNAEVLLTGENGTGKELVARAIHRQSNRANEIFINVDLGSISETLFESELFGHKKGAFTDAKENRIGRFEAANGGTIFLDEIGNLSPALQSKLLQVLQNRTVTRLGTNDSIDIDIRVICATNMHIEKMVFEGKFREDLLYRINTVEINIPKLIERREDIPLLVKHFVEMYRRKYNKPNLSVSESGIKKLSSYNWPGNVREMQHALERAVIMSEGEILQGNDFEFLFGPRTSSNPEDYNLEKLEEWAIRKAMEKHSGNISHASRELGLSRGAMYRRMEKYGI